VIVVSHDRYFMDKVVDHLMVFKGNAELKDFPGNYTDYREWSELMEEQEREEKNKESKTKNQDSRQQTTEEKPKPEKKKLSYKEQKELETLDVEIPQLEQKKSELENQMASGTMSAEEITKASMRHAELNDLIDEKTMRWLELSEL
jgi:ATP-binding cassette subfamily F protein uup